MIRISAGVRMVVFHELLLRLHNIGFQQELFQPICLIERNLILLLLLVNQVLNGLFVKYDNFLFLFLNNIDSLTTFLLKYASWIVGLTCLPIGVGIVGEPLKALLKKANPRVICADSQTLIPDLNDSNNDDVNNVQRICWERFSREEIPPPDIVDEQLANNSFRFADLFGQNLFDEDQALSYMNEEFDFDRLWLFFQQFCEQSSEDWKTQFNDPKRIVMLLVSFVISNSFHLLIIFLKK